MQTQKDHVEADRFQSLRVADAITFGHAPHLEARARRAGFGLVLGAIVAVLAVAGVGVYGLLVPGGATAWRQPGAIIMDKDSGAQMIYRSGALHTVRNYASALLAQGDKAQLVPTSSKSLAGVPLGERIGIVGAPDVVPPASGLATGRWLLCTSAVPIGGDAPDRAALTLLVDGAAGAPAMPTDRFVYVRDAGGRRWILAGGSRHAVDDAVVPLVLGVRTSTPLPVPNAWLRTRPVGAALVAPRIDGAGSAGPRVAGRRVDVGTLFRFSAENGRTEGLVALRDGLASVPPMEFAVLSAHASSVRGLSAAQLSAAPRSTSTIAARMPDLVHAEPVSLRSTAVCQRQRPDGVTEGTLHVLPVSGADFARRSTAKLNLRLAQDQGVYAAATNAVGSEAVDVALRTARRYLVIGDGQKYPLLTSAAATALGYGRATARPVPPALLALLPTGPALSRAAVGSRDR